MHLFCIFAFYGKNDIIFWQESEQKGIDRTMGTHHQSRNPSGANKPGLSNSNCSQQATDMIIRRAGTSDLDVILGIYANARTFQQANGNPSQWTGGYPQRKLLENDILLNRLYVITGDGNIQGVFMFTLEPEPTYAKIYEGQWPDSLPYGTIHRLASSQTHRGISRLVFDWCKKQCPRLRIDTHKDNIPMQRAVQRYGFHYCGIIHLADGSERLAYEYMGNETE